MAILLLQGTTTKETSSYAAPLPFILYVWKRNLHSSSKTRVAATSTLSLKANLLHTWAAFENELSASSSSHLSKTITGVLLYFAAEIPSLTASEKSLHSSVRKRKAKRNHEIEICQEIRKRKGMHLWAKCFLQSSEIGRCPKKNLSNKSMCLITLRRY